MYVSSVCGRKAAKMPAGPARSGKVGPPAARFVRSFALMAMLVASLWLGSQIRVNAAADAPADPAAGTRSPYLLHAVEPGDTLWSIASRHRPEGTELTAFIHEIRRFNEMETSGLTAGQVLKIPVRP